MTRELEASQERMRKIVDEVAARRAGAAARQAQEAANREAAEVRRRKALAAANAIDRTMETTILFINEGLGGSGLELGHERQDWSDTSIVASFSVGAYLDSHDLGNRLSFDVGLDGLIRIKPPAGQPGKLMEFDSDTFGMSQMRDLLLGFVEHQVPGIFGEAT